MVHANQPDLFDAFPTSLTSQPGYAEKRLWFTVVQLTLWDYAHLLRESWEKDLSTKRKGKLKRLHDEIFFDNGSMATILRAVAEDPDNLIDLVRGAVSDEQIRSGIVLGKKMRER